MNVVDHNKPGNKQDFIISPKSLIPLNTVESTTRENQGVLELELHNYNYGGKRYDQFQFKIFISLQILPKQLNTFLLC